MPARELLVARLSAFLGEFTLALSADELPADDRVPAEWRELLRAQDASGRAHVPRAWQQFAEELPTAHAYFAHALCGTAVLCIAGEEPALLYVHTYDGGARPSFYVGRPPVGEDQVPARIAKVWTRVPAKLREFYTTLHDGWTELASDAGGPAAVGRLSFLGDPDWELDPDVAAELPFRPEDLLLVFSNSAGDYLSLDTARRDWDGSSQGVLFFHDEPASPEVGQDFWALMDAWFGIFVERADGLRSAAGG